MLRVIHDTNRIRIRPEANIRGPGSQPWSWEQQNNPFLFWRQIQTSLTELKESIEIGH